MLTNLVTNIDAVEVDYEHGLDPADPGFEGLVSARLDELFAGTNVEDHTFSLRRPGAELVTVNFEADDEDDVAVIRSALRGVLRSQAESGGGA